MGLTYIKVDKLQKQKKKVTTQKNLGEKSRPQLLVKEEMNSPLQQRKVHSGMFKRVQPSESARKVGMSMIREDSLEGGGSFIV